MFVYKKLKASDIAVVPFNAHKQYTYTLKGKSDSIKHTYFITASWSQSAVDEYGAAACAHRQLEHLYYGDYPLDVANKFGNINYIKTHRQLDEEVYIYSIPQNMYGVQIKPKSLQLETIAKVKDFRATASLGNKVQLTGRFIDDGLGNIIHLETNLGSGSQAYTTESFPNSQTYNYPEYFKDDRVFYLNPINSYRFTDLTKTKHGKHIPDYATHSIHYDPLAKGLSPTLPEIDSTGCKVPSYSMEDVYEDSYYHGLIDYNNIRFTKYPYFPNYRLIPPSHSISETILGNQTEYTHHTFMDFHNQTPHSLNVLKRNDSGVVESHGKKGGSHLRAGHSEKFNFNATDDFTITFNLKPAPFYVDSNVTNSEFHIIGKSKTKTVNASALSEKAAKEIKLNISGANQEVEIESEARYPFEVFLSASSDSYKSLSFRRSNGLDPFTVSTGPIATGTGSIYNVVCQYSQSVMSIYIDNVLQVSQLETTKSGSICGKEIGPTENKANMYIGCQGGIQNFFTGSLQNIAIYPRALKNSEIEENYYESKYIGSPIVGNIFYSMGLITITNPYYFHHFKHHNITSSINFKNTLPLVENEYQCTVDEHDFNFTNNVSTRCITNEEHEHLANFATGSNFKPYVTTVGLYSDHEELLVVGKLGQPVKMSDETDTTFILRWDT